MRLAREPETSQSPAIPLDVFAEDAIDMHAYASSPVRRGCRSSFD
jgi:hypothetical protein